MRSLATIVIWLTIVYESCSMPADDESLSKPITISGNTFFDQFGMHFDEYYYGSNHTFMGSKAKIYKAYRQDKKVKYDLLNNEDVLPELMDASEASPTVSQQRSPASSQNNTEPSKNYTAYLRIVVVADHTIYEQHNRDVKKVVEYVTRFWTGVDLAFRQINRPQIRISIAGIIVATDEKATTYFVPFILGLLTDAEDSLQSMTKLRVQDLFQDQRVITAAMTTKYMTNDLIHTVFGIAFQGGACSSRFSKLIVRDQGAFTGLVTAIHELAHMLGAPHDDVEQGFSMDKGAQTSKGPFWANRLTFTQHTQKNITQFFSQGWGVCFTSKPDIGKPIKIKLPGVGLSLDDQCKKVYGSATIADKKKKGNEVCEHLWCVEMYLFKVIKVHQKSHRAPAEGTMCETGVSPKICLKAACVDIPKELESFYT